MRGTGRPHFISMLTCSGSGYSDRPARDAHKRTLGRLWLVHELSDLCPLLILDARGPVAGLNSQPHRRFVVKAQWEVNIRPTEVVALRALSSTLGSIHFDDGRARVDVLQDPDAPIQGRRGRIFPGVGESEGPVRKGGHQVCSLALQADFFVVLR